MFKNLISFWKGKGFLKEVMDDFSKMIQETEEMFKSVCDLLIRNISRDGLKDEIYRIDRQVNVLEKEIRKRIVGHLSLHPESDLPFCLVLMSVVKDAERLGDYAKNLFEVWEIMGHAVDNTLYEKYFDGLDKKIMASFEKTKQAFIESNEEAAENMLNTEREIVCQCDQIMKQLAASDLRPKEAVCFTLTARYFKRVVAHLTNIASSVILPISNLDFYDEKFRCENIKE